MANDMKSLSDELHDLADGIEAATNPAAARDRARRGIARRQRNRRAAVSAAAVTLVAAAVVSVAVDHDSRSTRQPVGTTAPTVSPTTTASSTVTAPPVTAPVVTTSPGTPITVTVPIAAGAATPAYAKTFAWGRQAGEVAFSVPGGAGVSGGPAAFTADAAGSIEMLDQSNSRIVRYANGSPTDVALALASPAVTAAAIDAQGRVIIATIGDLAVFGPDGHAQGAWKNMTTNQYGIYSLQVDGDRVYSVNGGAYALNGATVTRTLVLRDDGAGYVAVRNAVPVPVAINIDVEQDAVTIKVVATGATYRLVTGSRNDVRPVRLLPDGSLVFVVTVQQSDVNTDLNRPMHYVVGRIDRSGHATYESVTTSLGYTTGGPQFEINDDGLAVMGSTTGGGVTVSYYRFP